MLHCQERAFDSDESVVYKSKLEKNMLIYIHVYMQLGKIFNQLVMYMAICQLTTRKFRTVKPSSNLQHLKTPQLLGAIKNIQLKSHHGTGERWKLFVDKTHTCMLSARPPWMFRHVSVGLSTRSSHSTALHAHLRGLPARRMLPNNSVELLITTELRKNEPLTSTAKIIIRFVRIQAMKRYVQTPYHSLKQRTKRYRRNQPLRTDPKEEIS